MSASRKKKIEIKKVVTYARVSDPKQAEKDLSLPAQKDALRQYCREHGYEIVAEYTEPGVTGTDDKRKEFRRMMEDILAPSNVAQAVVVYHSSRFMRDATKARTWKNSLRKQGIRVIAMGQETSDDPMGRIIEGLFELIDQYESEINGLRTAAAMRENIKQGWFNGSRPPFGFKVEKIQVAPERFKNKLVPNPQEAEVVRLVFELYIALQGARSVARELNQRGYRYRKGHLWRKDIVLDVIEETAAIGTWYWGKTDTLTGEATEPEDWVPLKVEPILDKNVFDTAQRVRSQRDPKRFPGRACSSPLLLANIVRCGKCGAAYQLEATGRVGPSGDYYRYYNCRNLLRVGPEACKGFRIATELLESAVLDHIVEKLFTPERCRKFLKDMVEETGLLRQQTADQRKQLQKELNDIDGRIEKWQEGWETGQMPSDVGLDRVRELKVKRAELEQSLAKIAPVQPPPAYLYSDPSIARFQESIRGLFSGGNNSATRNNLRFLVDHIVVNDRKVEIHARKDAALLLMEGKNEETEVRTGKVHTSVSCLLRVVPAGRTGLPAFPEVRKAGTPSVFQ